MQRARPTLRALREDFKLPVPPADDLLDEIDHPLLAKASEQFADEKTKHERIRAITDEVLFKVKVQRWRGAVWLESDLPWIITAGIRQDGSPTTSIPRWRTTRRGPGRDTTLNIPSRSAVAAAVLLEQHDTET